MSVLEQFRLDGKTALLTGASRGLGKQMALAMAQAGASIVITGRDQANLDQAAAEIGASGVQVSTIKVDMMDMEQCEIMFKELGAGKHGNIDILVNNIGSRTGSQATQDLTLNDWQRAMDFNLTTCFLGTKYIGAAMIERGNGGRIINIASMNAFISNQGIGGRSYETSKAAMVQFTRSTAADWAQFGITANAICPGLFMTDANVEWNKTKPEVIEQITSSTPMGRAGEPNELGPLAVFLASPASSYMTGAALVIDGGYTLW